MLTIAFPYRPATVGSPPLKGRGPGWGLCCLLSPSISLYLPLSPSFNHRPRPYPRPCMGGEPTDTHFFPTYFRPTRKPFVAGRLRHILPLVSDPNMVGSFSLIFLQNA